MNKSVNTLVWGCVINTIDMMKSTNLFTENYQIHTT